MDVAIDDGLRIAGMVGVAAQSEPARRLPRGPGGPPARHPARGGRAGDRPLRILPRALPRHALAGVGRLAQGPGRLDRAAPPEKDQGGRDQRERQYGEARPAEGGNPDGERRARERVDGAALRSRSAGHAGSSEQKGLAVSRQRHGAQGIVGPGSWETDSLSPVPGSSIPQEDVGDSVFAERVEGEQPVSRVGMTAICPSSEITGNLPKSWASSAGSPWST